jgi:hypothetical protein
LAISAAATLNRCAAAFSPDREMDDTLLIRSNIKAGQKRTIASLCRIPAIGLTAR